MKTIGSRVLVAIPTVLGVFIVVFLIIRLIPGDPAVAILGLQATQEEVEQLRQDLGLNEPVIVQFFHFVSGYFSGDFGNSLTTRRPVVNEIFSRFPDTILLAVTAGILAVVIGVPLGMYASVKRGKLADTLSQLISTIGIATPTFWLGLMLASLFAVQLGWFSSIGSGRSEGFGATVNALVLPALSLALPISALIARMTRSSMLEVLTEDYIRTARSKGLSNGNVLFRHALRNASIPILTIVGISFGELLSGALVIETVFARPGVGKLLFDAILQRDYPVVQGVCLVIAVVFVLINLITDLLYSLLDPRVRLE